MPTPAAVIATTDAAIRLEANAPLLFRRMAAAGCDVREFVDELFIFGATGRTRYLAFLNASSTARGAKRRHKANRAAKRARRANRS